MIFEDAEVKKILLYMLDELFAIDGELRLEPTAIYKVSRRRHMKINILRKTCKAFDIPFCDNDLQEIKLENLPELIKHT